MNVCLLPVSTSTRMRASQSQPTGSKRQNPARLPAPARKGAVHGLVVELGKSLGVIKQASAVLTNFRFAVTADGRGEELARFNDYFIKSKTEAQFLRDHIEDLRTHYSKIRDYAQQIGARSSTSDFVAIFASVLNLRDPLREKQLAEKLDRLAFEDFEVANAADRMVGSLEAALTMVQNALGSGEAMYAESPFENAY
jgi:hypothetical protein